MMSDLGTFFLQASDLRIGAGLEALRFSRVGEQLAASLQIRSHARHFCRQPKATRELLRLQRSLPGFPLDARDPLARELDVGPELLQPLADPAQSGNALFALYDHALRQPEPLASPFDDAAHLKCCFQPRPLFVKTLASLAVVFSALPSPSIQLLEALTLAPVLRLERTECPFARLND